MFDQEISQARSIKSLLGAFLCVLSVAILFTDKVTTFGLTESYGYKTPETFIWMMTQSLGPIIFAIAAMLRPQRFFYFVPIYIYFIQVYWAFDSSLKVDDPVLHLYAIGFCIGAFIFLCMALFITKRLSEQNQTLIENLKSSTRYISVFISKKYIDKLPEEDQIDYTVDTVKYIDSLN